jgi:NADPH-dependent 2,4-dienoyl-CoA reductase/sulfur reductase-like enzyme
MLRRARLAAALRAACAQRWGEPTACSAGAARRLYAAAAFTADAPLRVCVVGSGPAGFYTADRVRGVAHWC